MSRWVLSQFNDRIHWLLEGSLIICPETWLIYTLVTLSEKP
jgi:hypothetical protein